MAELTIHIPDDLAARLEPLRDRLPELLHQLVAIDQSSPISVELPTANLPDLPQAYLEVLDFLINRPNPQDILAFKVSPTTQARLRDLLDKNRDGIATTAEVAELEVYEQLEHLMILMKARATASISS